MKNLSLYLSLLILSSPAFAAIKVVATSTDIGAIVQEVGGNDVSLDILSKGAQNLHALETKPSYMLKLSRADLFIWNGLGLEAGWLDAVVRGARNPKVSAGSKGNLELGSYLDPIEVPKGAISRSEGDVHPEGNPHWSLDPIREGKAALLIGDRLAQLDPAKAEEFKSRAKKFNERLQEKTKIWQKRLQATGITKVISYHKTLNYFLDRFGIESAGYLEPKPGIPPTTQHILALIEKIKAEKIRLILVEHFYDLGIAERIAKEVPTSKVKSVSAAVNGMPGINTNEELYEHIVKIFEESK